MQIGCLCAAVLALSLLGACKKKDDHLSRAREQMSKSQWANARTALGQALKEHPDDVTARSLQLYCIDHEDGLASVDGLSLISLFEAVRAPSTPGWDQIPQDWRTAIDKMIVDARKTLFDKGIDSKDNSDLLTVLRAAAAYGFEHEEELPRRDAAAAVLGIAGEQPAIDHLVDRLKTKDPGRIVEYLVEIGLPAAPALRAASRDAGFMGRRAALDALARVLATEQARKMASERPELRDPDGAESKASGKNQLGASALSSVQDLSVLRVHGVYKPLEGGADDGLVLLQSWDDQHAASIAEFYVLRAGDLQPLSLRDKDGAAVSPEGSVISEVAAERGVIVLQRSHERTVATEVDAGRVKEPMAGMRVRLQGYEPHGEVLREDAGLWIVRTDQPIDGMKELPVAPSAMIALKAERKREVSLEKIYAKIKPDRIEVYDRKSTPDPSDTRLPASCTQYKLLLERVQRCDDVALSTRKQLSALYDQLVESWKRGATWSYDATADSCIAGMFGVRQRTGFACGF